MKFAIILILLCYTACLDPKYNKYLENIDFTKEPVRKEWVSEGVEGYQMCNYKGDVSIWPETPDAPYKFIVWEGKISSQNTAKSSNIKSFVVPKGYKIKFNGQFMKEKFEPLTDDQRLQIANIPNNSKAMRKELATNEICSFNEEYWYANLYVYVNHYVKITRLIPDFISICITTQNLNIEKGTHTKKVKECMDQRENQSKSLFEKNNNVSSLKQSINEIKTRKIIIDEKVEIYTRLIIDQVYAAEWIQNVRNKNNEKNAELQKEIDLYNVKINNIICQQDLWLEKININNNIINKSKKTIRSVKEEISRRAIDLSKQQAELEKYGTIYKSIVEKLYSTNEINKNLNNEIEDIENQIKTLQEVLNKKKSDLKESQRLEKKFEEEVLVAKRTIGRMSKKFNEDTISKDFLYSIISKEESKINRASDDTITIQQNVELTKLSIQGVEEKVNEVKIKIEENNADSNVQTVEHYKKQLKIYQEEQIKFVRQLTPLVTELTKLEGEVNTLNSNISIAEGCITSEKLALNESNSKYEENYKLVIQKFNQMISIIDNPKSYLESVINSFDQVTPINIWLKTAKTNLFEYIESLPGDVEIVMDLVRRRRRMRRMRMRLI